MVPYTEKELKKKSVDQLKTILDLDFGYTLGTSEKTEQDLVAIVLELQEAGQNKEDRKFDFFNHLKDHLPLNEEMITDAFFKSSVAFRSKYFEESDLSEERQKQIFYEVRDIAISNNLRVERPSKSVSSTKVDKPKQLEESKSVAATIPSEEKEKVSNPHWRENTRTKKRIEELISFGFIENGVQENFSNPDKGTIISFAAIRNTLKKDWEELVAEFQVSSEEIKNNSDNLPKEKSDHFPEWPGDHQEAEQEEQRLKKESESKDSIKPIEQKGSTGVQINPLEITKKGDRVNYIIDLLISEGGDVMKDIKSKHVMDRYVEIYDDSVSDGYAYDKIAERKKRLKS